MPVTDIADLGNGMWILEVDLASLREQEINAHVMPPEKFQRLVENIRQRGSLESLPYCAQAGGVGHVEVISGHHRTRAARAAGLQSVKVLCDRSHLTRSQIIAKQIAHNALVGYDDEALLKQLAKMIDNVDDLLASGLPNDFLPTAEGDAVTLYSPHADFAWKFVTLSFLSHQMRNYDELMKLLSKQPQESIGVVSDELWKPFIEATARYARIKDIRSAGTAVALLIEIALREATALEAEAAEKEANDPKKKKAPKGNDS